MKNFNHEPRRAREGVGGVGGVGGAKSAVPSSAGPRLAGQHVVPTNLQDIVMMLNGKDSFWLQLEVCREYQRSRCTRSEFDCKFAHPPANVEVQPNGRVTACYDSIKGRCQREQCKYMHPPAHLKDQLLINGRNHLALKNAIMQQHQQTSQGIPFNSAIEAAHAVQTAQAAAVAVSGPKNTNPNGLATNPHGSNPSSALFQSALALAAARHQHQFAAAAAAAAAAVAAAQPPGSAAHHQNQHHLNQQFAAAAVAAAAAAAAASNQNSQPATTTTNQDHRHPHMKAFDMSMTQPNPGAALAAAFAASSMNPFMANPMFAVPQHSAYASQYAAAALAAAAAASQQHQHIPRPPLLSQSAARAPSSQLPAVSVRAPAIGLRFDPNSKQQAACLTATRADTPTTTSSSTGGSLKRSPDDSAFESVPADTERQAECDTEDQGAGPELAPNKRARIESSSSSSSSLLEASAPLANQQQQQQTVCDRLQSDKAESTTSSGCDVNSLEGADQEPAIADEHSPNLCQQDAMAATTTATSNSLNAAASQPAIESQAKSNGYWRDCGQLALALAKAHAKQALTQSPRHHSSLPSMEWPLNQFDRQLNLMQRPRRQPSRTAFASNHLEPVAKRTSSMIGSEPRLEICREFLRNNCKRGERDCRFAHPLAHHQLQASVCELGPTSEFLVNALGDSLLPAQFVIVCKDFLRGQCGRNTRCRYLHPASRHLQCQLSQQRGQRKV